MTLGPQFEQLQMFMTGKELQNRIEFSHDKQHDETLPQMWERKAYESRDPLHLRSGKVYGSLLTDGVRDGTIMQLSHQPTGARVYDGHHRIAAAADLEEQGDRQLFFPVQHYPGDSGDVVRMQDSDIERANRRTALQ